ncbi:hypothetical protein MCUN1_001468 [Malassezia cuniculi]|uniref:Galactose-binding domain-like protein n=1 Tax=Malassezia cuniculi TaxID=948313 RepID=A0AAF0EXP7_9BASI|nr:hypothetical protein MCUN1_001468 [Malassezia cuniculi]
MNVLASATALDGSLETCWTVELGNPAVSTQVTLTATLDEAVRLCELKNVRCTCGGGFSPVRIAVDALTSDWVEICAVFPADSNMAQTLPLTIPDALASQEASAVRLRLGGSTDAFGRVIIYELGLLA